MRGRRHLVVHWLRWSICWLAPRLRPLTQGPAAPRAGGLAAAADAFAGPAARKLRLADQAVPGLLLAVPRLPLALIVRVHARFVGRAVAVRESAGIFLQATHIHRHSIRAFNHVRGLAWLALALPWQGERGTNRPFEALAAIHSQCLEAAGSIVRSTGPARDLRNVCLRYGVWYAHYQGTGAKSLSPISPQHAAKSSIFSQFRPKRTVCRTRNRQRRRSHPYFAGAVTLFSTSAIRPCRSAVGLGGQPPMCKSTGMTVATPPTQA